MRLPLPCILSALILAPGPAWGDVLIVDSLEDHDGSCGPMNCTLREAIGEADSGDTIVFDFSALPPGEPIIVLQSPLPELNRTGLTIDGYDCIGCGDVAENTSLPADGFDLAIGPTIDGALLPVASSSDLLVITAGGVTVRGLNLRNAGDEAIVLLSGSDSVVEGCLIGTDRAGLVAQPNQGGGVLIRNADRVTIGPNNVISGNGLAGVRIEPSSGPVEAPVLIGNLIGLDITGGGPLPNAGPGVLVEPGNSFARVQDLVVGDGTEVGRNIISGNSGGGCTRGGASTSSSSRATQSVRTGRRRRASAAVGGGSASSPPSTACPRTRRCSTT